MKKLGKIVALIGIMLIITLSLTGCEIKIGGNSNKRAIDAKELTGYTEYTHSSGAKFSYPEDWSDLGTTSKPVFASATTGTNVNLLTEQVSSIYNISSYMSASIANIKASLGSQIDGEIAQEDVKLNGKDASIISYTMTQSGVKVNIKQVCFIEDNKAYILTAAATEAYYEDDVEVLDNIISSFTK